MKIAQIKKYKNSMGYKIQIITDYSIFKINGATPSKNDYVHNLLMDAAENQINKRQVQHYIIEDYVEPNYGIMGLNIRVFDSQELKDKYLENEHRREERAKKELEKYQIKKAAAILEEEKIQKEDEIFLKDLYQSKVADFSKIRVDLPKYDGMSHSYRKNLTIGLQSSIIEDVLNGIKEIPKYQVEKTILGEDLLTYEEVNNIIKWINSHTNKYQFPLIDKTFNVRLPMAYCELDKTKYVYGTKEYYKAYDKLINYKAVAFDIG